MKMHTIPVLETAHEQNRMTFLLQVQLQLAILISLIGFVPGGGGASAGDANSGSRQLFWGMAALISVGYIVVTMLAQRERRFAMGSWSMATMIGYVIISALWSISPDTTIKRAILLVILVVVCGLGVGMRKNDWRDELFSTVLAKPFALLLILSLLITLISPSRAFSDIGWRGVFSHKNEAGQVMAMATLLLLYGVCHKKMGIKFRVFLIALTFSALILSKSTTALLALIVGVSLTELGTLRSTIHQMGSWRIALVGALLMLSCLVFFAFQLDFLPSTSVMYSKILAALGKSETFTGRTAIWDLVLGESRFHNPWFGGGYGAFWVGRESVSGYVIIGNNLYPGQSHNGYIDIYNDLGIIGLILLGMLIIVAIVNSARLLMANHNEGKLHVAIVLLCIFLNLGESTFLRNTTFMNIMFIASFIRVVAILNHRRMMEKAINNEQHQLIPKLAYSNV